jgi:signal transduction histidine kinase
LEPLVIVARHRLPAGRFSDLEHSVVVQSAPLDDEIATLDDRAWAELKAGDLAQARATSQELVATATSALDAEHVKRGLVALDRIVAYSRLLEGGFTQVPATLDLYEFLITYRFMLDEATYGAYTERVKALIDGMPALDSLDSIRLIHLRSREQQLDWVAASIQALAEDARVLPAASGQAAGQEAVQAYSVGSHADATLTVVPIRVAGGAARQAEAFVVYSLERTNISLMMLLMFAGNVVPWTDVGLALMGVDGKPAFSSLGPVPDDAALATTSPARVPGWRVAAFPQGSIGALAAQDVHRYAGLLILVFGTVVVSVSLAARSMWREIALARLRSDFVASVSHELKTPLSLIRMFAENLRQGWVAEDKKDEYYEVITRETERLSGLISNVLDFSRIEAGTRTYRFAVTDMRAIVVDLLDRYRFHLKAANIDLSEDLPPHAVYAYAEREAMEQVLLNLLSNAVKYMGDVDRLPRRVEVSLRVSSTGIWLTITDTGIGMSDEQRAHIFERFYRADDERVRAVPGSGLGLTLVKHIVEAHRGAVTVESAPDRGSTFAITLPFVGADADS